MARRRHIDKSQIDPAAAAVAERHLVNKIDAVTLFVAVPLALAMLFAASVAAVVAAAALL